MTDASHPYSYSIRTAQELTGLTEWQLRQLVREDKIAHRYAGQRLIIMGDSLRAYIDSLPSEWTRERNIR